MKRAKCFVFLLLMNCLFINVSADMLATPEHDSFYNQHQDEIKNGSNYYIEAQRDIAVVDCPGSSNIIGVIAEGRVLHLHYYYEDEHGDYWGMQVIDDSTCAWFQLKYVSEVYWYWNFWMDHEKEIKHLAKRERIYFEEDAWLVLWECPGSEMISGTLHTSDSRDTQIPLTSGSSYTDEKGVRWVSVRFKGQQGWLNMSEPLRETRPEVMDVTLDLEENFDPSEYDFSESIFDLYGQELLIGTLVIGVCGLTGVLTLLKRKRS